MQLNSVKSAMKVVVCIMLLLLVGVSAIESITLEQLSSLAPEQLHSGQMVEVVHSSQIDIDQGESSLERQYYVMRVISRNKRSAFEQMNKMIGKVVMILKKYRIIPHEGTLIKSKIKPQYLNKKRKWTFSTIFVVLGNHQQLQKCFSTFTRLGIQKLNSKPSIHFLNQKIKALHLFASAKAKLEAEIKRFPNFHLKQIEQIQIEGLHMPNSDLIQKQIEEEFSESEENMEEKEIRENEQEQVRDKITVRVVFQVAEVGEEDSEFEFEDEQEDEDSDDTQDDTEQESM